MLVDKIIEKLSVKSYLTTMIIGSVITALSISLGIYLILYLWGFEMNAGIPAAFAAIGASLFAARYKRNHS